MCEVTEDCLCTGSILADYEAADTLGRKIGGVLARAKKIRMTSADGTDLVAEISGRPVQYETGLFRNPGDFAALPSSEVNISPVEGTTNGVIHGDVRLMGYGIIREEPITIRVGNGSVVDIQGGKGAEYLKNTLEAFNDPKAYNLAEFAVGLSPCSRAYATNLEDLGRLGFGHHGIGSNYAIGGNVLAPCHIDIIYANAILEVDGKIILDKGRTMI